MCNMGKNHVHHSIKFRLDLNGTLPLLTLGSTSPDKLICSGPCQMPSQPPPAHREKHSDLVYGSFGLHSLPCPPFTLRDPGPTRS